MSYKVTICEIERIRDLGAQSTSGTVRSLISKVEHTLHLPPGGELGLPGIIRLPKGTILPKEWEELSPGKIYGLDYTYEDIDRIHFEIIIY